MTHVHRGDPPNVRSSPQAVPASFIPSTFIKHLVSTREEEVPLPGGLPSPALLRGVLGGSTPPQVWGHLRAEGACGCPLGSCALKAPKCHFSDTSSFSGDKNSGSAQLSKPMLFRLSLSSLPLSGFPWLESSALCHLLGRSPARATLPQFLKARLLWVLGLQLRGPRICITPLPKTGSGASLPGHLPCSPVVPGWPACVP